MMHTFIPQSVDALVDRQIRRWNAQRRRSAEKPRPIVTISRQYGAGGSEIASLLADRLGFVLWNGALLEAIAEHAHAPARLFSSLDEHRRSVLAERIAVFGAGRHVTASDYLRELTRLVRTIMEGGSAVVVGRGAQYLVDTAEALRVRVVRPLDQRVVEVSRRTGAAFTETRLEILSVDADRSDFIQEHYGRDVDDPAGYDVVVNTETMRPNVATGLLESAYRARFPDAFRAQTGAVR